METQLQYGTGELSVELPSSCYEGGDLHCGLCGTCNERKEAFQLAGVPDPTNYRESNDLHR